MLRVLRGYSGDWLVIYQASMGLELSKKLTFYIATWFFETSGHVVFKDYSICAIGS